MTVSYFEWVQNNQGYYWSEDEVNEKLREKLIEAFDTIYELAQNRKIDMRLAAYIVELNVPLKQHAIVDGRKYNY